MVFKELVRTSAPRENQSHFKIKIFELLVNNDCLIHSSVHVL